MKRNGRTSFAEDKDVARGSPMMAVVNLVGGFLVAACVCRAQTDSNQLGLSAGDSSVQRSALSIMRTDGSTALRAAAYVLVAPSRWDATDLLVAGEIAAGTVGSYLLDNEASGLMERNHSSFNDDLTSIAVEYGSGYLAIGLPVTMYAYGIVAKDDWIRETAVLMGTAVLLTSATTTIGKIVIGRARPYTGLGRHEFKPFKGRADFMSFPSGHTTAAFALSAVLAARIKNPWASVGLYGAATAAAVSRMYSLDHWLSDLVFTAAYTTVVAHSIVDWFENGERSGEPKSRLNVVPTVNGVSVVWRF